MNTVVTACDHGYIWGAFLVCASIRRAGMTLPLLIGGRDFTPEDIQVLEQFDARVVCLPQGAGRSVATQKPDALACCTTDQMTWIDADCMVTGDMTALLTADPGDIQIRFRSYPENAEVYRVHYRAGDTPGPVPAHIQQIWRRDVGERDEPRVDTQLVTNSFVITADSMPFIEAWRTFMQRVIPEGRSGTVDAHSEAYFMTDESALTALYAYRYEVPRVTDYLMDNMRGPYLVHFGTAPKPWRRWTRRTLRYRPLVVETIDWVLQEGLRVPPLPRHLHRDARMLSYWQAYHHHFVLRPWSRLNKYVHR